MALRHYDRGLQIALWQAAMRGVYAHALPVRHAHLRAQAGAGQVHTLGQRDLMHPRFIRAPALGAQHRRARHDRIGGRGFQRDLPVAIAIDCVVDNVRGQLLHHTDLTRPSAGHAARVQIAPAVHFQRRENLRAEQFRATAIMRQRDQRIHRVEIALHRAEIGFKRPEGQQYAGVHPELAFGRIKNRPVTLVIANPVIQTVLRNQRAREIQKRALEDALSPVGSDDRRIAADTGEKPVHQGAVIAHADSFCFQPANETAEIAATALRLRLGADQCCRNGECFQKMHFLLHANFSAR